VWSVHTSIHGNVHVLQVWQPDRSTGSATASYLTAARQPTCSNSIGLDLETTNMADAIEEQFERMRDSLADGSYKKALKAADTGALLTSCDSSTHTWV
jgi:hypothetical protein